MNSNKRLAPNDVVNVGARLTQTARANPNGMAIAEPLGYDAKGKRQYRRCTFRELDQDSTLLASGLADLGAEKGSRLALLVRPGIDFISLVFAMLKAGITIVLIDPGMGRKNMIKCLSAAQPDGFVAIPQAHALRVLLKFKFSKAKINVTAGKRWFWRGPRLADLRKRQVGFWQPPVTVADDPAAIIFTTGSTGPPKGVLYRQGNFDRQVTELQEWYNIAPGEIDLPGFPLFALFNCAMGVGTVIPDMDFTRPASVDPKKFLEAAHDFKVTQAFGSPALWNTVGRYCEETGSKMPTLRRALSAGAPVPPHVIQRVRAAIHPDGDIYTPYGATESLPVASIAGATVLDETEAKTAVGKGVCVGTHFPGIEWRVIKINDGALESVEDTEEVAEGEIGELMVTGDVVTTEYAVRKDCNPLHKVRDHFKVWHRLGDLGYLDERNRFWFCGRKSHRVRLASRDLYTIPCEAISNQHPFVYRSALVGIGDPGEQVPVMILELWPDKPRGIDVQDRVAKEVRILLAQNELTKDVEHVFVHPSLPVDIRHNSKIFRERLVPWAAARMKQGQS